MITPAAKALVGSSPVHGRGVFAAAAITAGEVVERCPVLRVPAAQREQIDATLLFEYYFDWDGDAGVAFGFGSLYNHSGTPNAEYLKELSSDTLLIRALVSIAPGDEITISYSGHDQVADRPH